jgi:DNA-binding FrmR family transcriptional regulator
MAEAECVFKKVEVDDELKCFLCHHIYTTPKLLQCFHVYCQSCLLKVVSREQPENPTIACPVCKQVTPVPEGGVEALFAAFHINRKLKALREKDGTGEDAASEESINYCSDHGEDQAKMYCETCGVLICSKCVALGGKHHRHDYDSIKIAFEKYKEEIGSAIKPMEEKLASVRKALDDLDKNCSNVTDQEASVQATISDTMRQIHAILDTRQAELLDQLQQVTDAKIRDLEAQKSKLKTTHMQLVGAMDFVKDSTAEEGGRLMMRTTTSLHPDDLKPSVEADMHFEASPDVTDACQNFGEISVGKNSKGIGIDGRSAKAKWNREACELFLNTHGVGTGTWGGWVGG